MALVTNYLGHDAEFARRRAMGRKGWDDEASYQQTINCLESFLSGVTFPGDPTLIELGCGAGDLSLWFATRGFRVIGVDISPLAIQWAQEKASKLPVNASFRVGDLTRDVDPLPPPADLVLDGHCLHCIIGPDRQIFLQNARRCLKPEGVLHINTMCGDPHPPNDRGYDPVSRCIVIGGVAMRYFGTAQSIQQELIQAGFEIIEDRVVPAQYPGDEDCLLLNARSR